MSIDKEIVEDFVSESKSLIGDLIDLLEGIEGDFAQVKKLADYGNNVDRIMGGARNLALMAPEMATLRMIADYAALCKAVGYKASQIQNNPKLYDVCVAILLDASETLQILITRINSTEEELRKEIPAAFIERLRWVSQQFSDEYSMSVGAGASAPSTPKKLKQSEIDDLLKKLGL